MNVESATVSGIPWGQAQTAFIAYRKAVKTNKATRDDVMLYKALRRVLRGQHVIDINIAIGSAGRDDAGRPKLAIARADWADVICDGEWTDGKPTFRFASTVWRRRVKGAVNVSATNFPAVSSSVPSVQSIRCAAQVPMIPPQHRPEGDLAEYHILFEAEWRKAPPVDPMLLKHVDGPFYVVLACWDLSPLEQAVMRQRL